MRILAAPAAALLGAVIATAAGVPAARADDEAAAASRSYASVGFSGGLLLPRGDLADRAGTSLDVNARIGWTSSSGVGLMIEGGYSPLRLDEAWYEQTGLVEVDGHLFTVTGGPRFTLGHKVVRPWVYLGGGAVIQRLVTEIDVLGVSSTDVETETKALGRAAVGLDFLFFSNGGITLAGSYARTFEDDAGYELLQVLGGLVFTL